MGNQSFDRCKNCNKDIDFRKHKRAYQTGGNKKVLFSWCSKKCEKEYYSKVEQGEEK